MLGRTLLARHRVLRIGIGCHRPLGQRQPRSRSVSRPRRFGSRPGDVSDAKAGAATEDAAASSDSGIEKADDDGEVDERTGLPRGITRPVAIMTGAMFFNNLGFGCVVPVLPLFADGMGLGATGVGTILSTSALARLLANIPMGRAADTLGRRPLMIAGGGTVAAASVATGLATDLPSLLAARLLVGCGGSAAGAGAGAYMADVTSRAPGQRAKIMGAQSTVVNGAYALGPAVGGYLCDLYGARSMFFVVGAANAVCTVGYSMLPESMKALPSEGTGDANTKSSDGGEQRPCIEEKQIEEEGGVWAVYRELLRDPDRQGLMAMNAGLFCSYSAMLTLLPLHASDVLGEAGTATAIGGIFAASSMISFVGIPLGGYLADRFGRRSTVVPSALLVCAGAALTAGASSLETLTGAVLVWGMGNSMVGPGVTAFTADIARDEGTRSQALSLSNTAMDLSLLVCPLSLGALAQLTDCPTALLATSGVVGAANMLFALRTTEPRHQLKSDD